MACEALAMSAHVKHVKKPACQGRSGQVHKGTALAIDAVPACDIHVCMSRDVGLELCADRLLPLVENLCKVLKKIGRGLKVTKIEWVDDFPENVSEADLQARRNVLLPFTSLKAQSRIKKLEIAEEGRQKVTVIMLQVLEGANVNA